MNEILINICTAAIITAIFKMLVPGEMAGKQVKILLSCFFVVSVINVFKNNININLSDYITDMNYSYSDYSLVLEKQTADTAANNLRERIKKELLNENITPQKIYIDINISESGSISFNEIRLVFNDIYSEAAERAVRITEECTGYEIKVSLEET